MITYQDVVQLKVVVYKTKTVYLLENTDQSDAKLANGFQTERFSSFNQVLLQRLAELFCYDKGVSYQRLVIDSIV